jgi:phage tail sheath gpL-like
VAISFSQIPVGLRVPGVYVEIDNTGAVRSLPGYPSRVLVLGQMLPTGTATAGVPVRVTDAIQAQTLFGIGSMLARQFGVVKANDRWTETWAIPLADAGAGVAATGSITFGGSVSSAGTLNLYVAGRRVRVAVTVSEANATTASNVASAVNAVVTLPVTAAVDGVDTTKVNLTARHKGENGNHLDVRVNYQQGESLPAGLTATIVALSGGSGNPDVSTALTAMSDEWFTDICMPWSDSANLAALETELADRFGPMVAKEAHAYAATSGTHTALVTFGDARNSPHLSVIGAKASPTPPEEWAAALTAVAAFYLHQDPARPLQTLPLKGVLPPAISDRFTVEERNLLLYDGVVTWTVDAAGQVLIERCVTTYQENAFGVADISYLDVQTPKTLGVIRFNIRQAIAAEYPRHKLASDGTRFGSGQAIATPRAVKGTIVARLRQLEDVGLVESVDSFKDDILVERDESDPNKVNALIPPDVVNQFRVFAGKIQFLL